MNTNFLHLDSNISQEKKNKLIKSWNESYEFLGYTESISNGCSSTGMIFEFLYEEELDFEPKYLGLWSRISDTLDIKPTKEYLEGMTYITLINIKVSLMNIKKYI